MSQFSSVCSREDNNDIVAKSWARFLSKIAPGSDGMEELLVLLEGTITSACHHCCGLNVIREEGDRTFSCLDCGAISWFTSGTFFQGVKKPIVWMGAIHLIEEGLSISANRLSRLANVAYHTAWTVMKKLELVVDSHQELDSLSLPDFLFETLFCKRSRETLPFIHPSNDKPRADTEQLDKRFGDHSDGVPSPDGQRNNEYEELSARELLALQYITDAPQSFDSICNSVVANDKQLGISTVSATLMMLELTGLIQRTAGDFYVRAKVRPSKAKKNTLNDSEKTLVLSAIESLKATVSGISRKYLQLYLAKVWCCADKKRWGEHKLFLACAKSQNYLYTTILSYSSASVVSIGSILPSMETRKAH